VKFEDSLWICCRIDKTINGARYSYMNQGTERPILFSSVEFEDSLKLYTSIMDWLRTYQDKF